MPEVDRVIDMGAYQELQCSGDPQRLLKSLVQLGSVQHFEISDPSLHDIFIRIAGADSDSTDSTEGSSSFGIDQGAIS
jgi:ABC-type uncharacterized transport system ATPase subunit